MFYCACLPASLTAETTAAASNASQDFAHSPGSFDGGDKGVLNKDPDRYSDSLMHRCIGDSHL